VEATGNEDTATVTVAATVAAMAATAIVGAEHRDAVAAVETGRISP
jgi:hypothetical protein